jgi:hypothetical protein
MQHHYLQEQTRFERAYQAILAFEPNLHRSMSYINNAEDLYSGTEGWVPVFRSSFGTWFKNCRLEKGT